MYVVRTFVVIIFPLITKLQRLLSQTFMTIYGILAICRIKCAVIVKCAWTYTGYEVYVKSSLSGFSIHTLDPVNVIAAKCIFYSWHIFQRSHLYDF